MIISRRPNFVLFRGLLTKLLETPYENQDDWTIAAMQKNGTIYLRHMNTDESLAKRREFNSKPFLQKMAAWGRTFEDYMLMGTMYF